MRVSQYRVFVLSMFLAFAFGVPTSIATAAPTRSKAKKKTKATKPRVAVLYFDQTGKDTDLQFLRKGLTQLLISDLSVGDDLVIVERTDIEMVLKELKLGQTKFINRKTANKIGQLLGAQYLITGNYFNFRETLHITAKVIDVKFGTVEGVTKHRKVIDFMEMEHQLADDLRITLHRVAKISAQRNMQASQAARAKRRKRLVRAGSKVSAKTVALYGQALDSIDQGDKKLAMKQLSAIEETAPDFTLAADDLRTLLR